MEKKHFFFAHLVLRMFQSFKKDQFQVDFALPGQTFMRWRPKGLICHNTLQSVQIELEKFFLFTICDLLSIFYFMKNIELLVNFWSLFCKIL